jgi:hypothetical protein
MENNIMPVLNLETMDSKQIWNKGNLTIWEVTLNYQGKTVKAKTYSKAISTPGWSGEVETYEKPGRNGSETFVKQPQREDGGNFSKPSFSKSAPAESKPSKPQFDNYTMYLSYAKDVAVACIQDGKFDTKLYNAVIDEVSQGGTMLYFARPGAEDAPSAEPTVSELNATFPDADNFTVEGEKIVDPWENES